MIKITPPGSYDFGEEASRLIKVSSAGLRGSDLSAFVKRAGHELADAVKKMAFAPGEVPIHALAMSAHEAGGANRNADTWYEEDLRKDHHTFEKYARFFRDHRNGDPAKSYGLIKKSYYNPEMKRVELIIALNGTKEAADRNGGLVADKEINTLEKGDELPGSMSTKIAKDICLCCGNESRTRAEYCDESTCSHGGMKKHAGRVCDDGQVVCVSNHGNKFFDWSAVYRPADRTAYVLGKVASFGEPIVSGAELAEILGVTAPDTVLVDGNPLTGVDTLARIKIAREQAAREASLVDASWARAFHTDVRPELTDLHHIEPSDRAAALKALGREKIALSLSEWVALTTGAPAEKCASCAAAVRPTLAHAYQELLASPDLSSVLRSAALPGTEPPPRLTKWASAQAAGRSVELVDMQRRVWQAALRGTTTVPLTKTAGHTTEAIREIARHYAAYQVEFLYNLQKNPNDVLTPELLIHQNRS